MPHICRLPIRNGIVWFTAAFCLVAWAVAMQAAATPIHSRDEPLWFMRSGSTPADLSSPEKRFWAIDVPGLNRWVWWSALTATGLREPPRGEGPCWRTIGSRLYWRGSEDPDSDARALARTERMYGAVAPEAAIYAMRTTNVIAFLGGLAMLYAVALRATGSHAVSTAAVAPIVVSPLFALNLAFLCWSGDSFLFAGLALVLLVWTRRPQPTLRNAALVGAACGLALGAKLVAMPALAAYCAWALWRGRGRSRILAPAAACAAALAVFAILNPVVIMHPSRSPIQIGGNAFGVLAAMCARRAQQSATLVASGMPLTWATMLAQFTPYWPLVPINIVASARAMRDPSRAPIALWGVALWGSTLAAYVIMGVSHRRYLGPAEYSLFFSTAVLVLGQSRSESGRARGDGWRAR